MAELIKGHELLQDAPSLMAVVLYDTASKYAIISETEQAQCILQTRDELAASVEELPNILSQRVLLLKPGIRSLRAYYSPTGGLLDSTVPGIVAPSHLDFNIPVVGLTDKRKEISLNEKEAMHMLYKGVTLFQGEGRKTQDIGMLIYRDHDDGQEQYQTADMLFIDSRPSDRDASGQANVMVFLESMINAIKSEYGGKPEYAEMWVTIDAIIDSDYAHLQELMVATHLIAEQRLMDMGQLSKDIPPGWMRLRDKLAASTSGYEGFKLMLNSLFDSQAQRTQNNTIVGSFIKEKMGNLILDDYNPNPDPVVPYIQITEKDIVFNPEFNTTYMYDLFEKIKAKLRQAEKDLEKYGPEEVAKGKAAVLDTFYDRVTEKAQSLLEGKQTMSGVPGLNDCLNALRWMFEENPEWWSGKGETWLTSSDNYNPGESFIERKNKDYKPSDEWTPPTSYTREVMASTMIRYLSKHASNIEIESIAAVKR